MANFKQTVITKAAHNLIAKSLSGSANINFTRVATSKYDYKSFSQSKLESLTSLEDIKQYVAVDKVEKIGEASVNVSVKITNANITEGYYVNTIGLFAIDPEEGEILYSVTVAETADYFPADNGVNCSGINLDLVTEVSNASNVNITVNYAGYATNEDIEKVNSHLNENVKNIKKLNGTNNYVSDLNNCSITGEKITVKTNESTLNTPYKVGITGLTIGSVDIYNLDINFELQIYNAFGSVNRYVRSKNNGTWSDWSILKDIDSGWLNLPLGSGIIVDGGLTPQYRKIGNRVFIRGSVKNIVTGNTVIGTLPVGFRPVLQNHHYATFTNTNACASFNISTDGRIIYQGNSTNTFNAEWFVVITNNFII
ncbi:pyocin knob domain-containing protein [Clostridium butyricum]|uniref:pyocin knob domain-containing protein n=1 Tax=Clostridium butyricum TaxID=1492 RepID=UPI0009036477|nr:pyocin knob domain-containing protein [Clostridium butyricum]APF23190.1 hypothetical protein NPD4_1289 [Clostridium butyricum]